MSIEGQDILKSLTGTPIEIPQRERVVALLQAILSNNIDQRLTRELASGILSVFEGDAESIFKMNIPDAPKQPNNAPTDIDDIINSSEDQHNAK
ncbi:MAG: hypothetical protein COA78_38350 [Blastopirellula sp.]|nr:MAG: hypothetical protein COA78_38350 [Blastopirellula sp.]